MHWRWGRFASVETLHTKDTSSSSHWSFYIYLTTSTQSVTIIIMIAFIFNYCFTASDPLRWWSSAFNLHTTNGDTVLFEKLNEDVLQIVTHLQLQLQGQQSLSTPPFDLLWSSLSWLQLSPCFRLIVYHFLSNTHWAIFSSWILTSIDLHTPFIHYFNKNCISMAKST